MAFSLKTFRHHEWLCKTNFSFLSATSDPYDLVETSLRLDYGSLCINDFDGVYGIARVFNDRNYIKKQTGKEIKLNYGVEIHLNLDHESPILYQNNIVLNALTYEGYKNINRIISYAHRDSKDRAWLSLEKLLDFKVNGVACLIPMRGGLQDRNIFLLKEKFKKNFYLTITKTFNRKSDRLISKVYDFAEKSEGQILFCQDAFMVHRDEKGFHDVLLTIKNNNTISENLSHFFPNGERCLHTNLQIYNTYKNFLGFERMVTLSNELNEKSNFCLSLLKYHYPGEFIPKGFTAQEFLEEKSYEGAKRIYGESLPPKIVTLLNKELDLIEELGFADYFLTVWDIVSFARSQKILCQGRGSAANSAVCFVLGVTSCDPTHFDLLFERFISRERGDPPDIDIDFEHERREEVLQYIYKRYGRNKAAMVANIITFKSKGAMRAVGKALGISEEIITKTSKNLSTVIHRKEELSSVIELEENETNADLPWNLWKIFSEKILGFPRHMGLHSGGFIISQYEIDDLVPREPASMEGRTIIQWAKDDIEELGFFKIDCLSLGMLSALRKCFDYVENFYGKKLELYQIPPDDRPTYQMIQNADTVGVFQIESRAQQEMAPRFRPRDLYDLVIQIATIRPGPLQGQAKNPLIRRRNGTEEITYPCEEVKNILSKTMGVLVFQEQLMRIAVELGDFTAGEANELRKNIGAWNSKAFNRNLNPFMKKLFKGLKKRNIKKEFMIQLMEHMKGFAHYGFPESHAISFAFLAYASAYLKCHYPAAFYTSILNSQPMGFYTPHALLQSAKRDRVEILPLSINESNWDHGLELLPTKTGRPPLYAIRLGFRIVNGLSLSAVTELSKVREINGKWETIESFIETTHIFKDDYTALAAAGAFECFGLKREDAIWHMASVPFRPLIDIEERKIKWHQKDELEKIQQDFTAFGTSLSTHPVKLIREKSWRYNLNVKKVILSNELLKLKTNDYVSVFGMMVIKQAPPSAKGMVFFTLEDECGFLNLVFTPQVYRHHYKIIENSNVLCISGDLQIEGKSHSVMVKKVYVPEVPKNLNLSLRDDYLQCEELKKGATRRNYQ